MPCFPPRCINSCNQLIGFLFCLVWRLICWPMAPSAGSTSPVLPNGIPATTPVAWGTRKPQSLFTYSTVSPSFTFPQKRKCFYYYMYTHISSTSLKSSVVDTVVRYANMSVSGVVLAGASSGQPTQAYKLSKKIFLDLEGNLPLSWSHSKPLKIGKVETIVPPTKFLSHPCPFVRVFLKQKIGKVFCSRFPHWKGVRGCSLGFASLHS